MSYIVYDLEDRDFDFVESEQEARDLANDWLNAYRDNALADGWPEGFHAAIGYSQVVAHIVCCNEIIRDDYTKDQWAEMGYNSDFDTICDFTLQPVEEIKS